MFTKKSLIVGLTLLLAIVCAGSVGAFASSASPATSQSAANYFPAGGIPAIPAENGRLLRSQEVENYLNERGFVGGETFGGDPVTISLLGLTDLDSLSSLTRLNIPDLTSVTHAVVYYTELQGPFRLDQNLSLPVLSTLNPSLGNLSVLDHLTGLNDLPLTNDLRDQDFQNVLPVIPGLDNLENSHLLHDLLISHGLPDTVGPNSDGVLSTVYEVFDAHSGNLLAWG